MTGTAFTRREARQALVALEEAFDTDAGWALAVDLGEVNRIFGALTLLTDYIENSKPVPLIRKRTREDMYASQVGVGAT